MAEQIAWPAAAGLVVNQFRYHLRLTARTPRALLAGVLLPTIVLAMHGTDAGTRTRQHALLAGLAVLGALSTSYVTHATGLVLARESGVLRRWRMSPLPAWCFFAGKTLATALLACASAAATVLVAAPMGVSTAPTHLLVLLFPIAIGALCWATVATAVSGLIPGSAAAYPMLTATYLPLVIVSGALGTPSGAPAWLRTAADYLPIRPVVNASHAALRGTWPIWSFAQLAVLASWAIAAAAAAAVSFRWAPAPERVRRPARARRSAGA